MADAIGLPDDGQHRHMVQLGVVEAVEQMDGARSRSGHAHTEVAGELGVAHRLEGGHLLVAGLDELWRGVGFDPRPENPVDAVSGVGEDLHRRPMPAVVPTDSSLRTGSPLLLTLSLRDASPWRTPGVDHSGAAIWGTRTRENRAIPPFLPPAASN